MQEDHRLLMLNLQTMRMGNIKKENRKKVGKQRQRVPKTNVPDRSPYR